MLEKIKNLVASELERARSIHTDKTHSPHEGYAVALEEFEELKDEIEFMESRMKLLWDAVKKDEYSKQIFHLEAMLERTDNMIYEAVQFAAMLKKMRQDI